MPESKAGDQSMADLVILRVLQEAREGHGRPIYRTALVKLVYLVDYVYAQHNGHTLTGLDYVWDDYGPNAAGNQIAIRADRLESSGAIEIDRGQTPSGNQRYVYRLVGRSDVTLGDDLGKQVIRDIVGTYGSLNWSEIVKAANATRPVVRAKQGERLDLSRDPQVERRLAKVGAALEKRNYEVNGSGASISELKARYGLPE